LGGGDGKKALKEVSDKHIALRRRDDIALRLTEEASMYRKRRRKVQKRRRATVIAAFAAILVVAVGVPTLASGADRVDNILGQVGSGGGSGSTDSGSGATSGGGNVSDKAGVPPDNYVPPLHGTDPHGQGSIATVDLTPDTTNPYGSDPSTSDEEVVVGDSNGTQSGGQYHGQVTVLWLFGNPVIQVTSNPGESNDGPLQPLQDGLDQLCQGSSGQVCLTVLGMHSSSTGNSSTNSFELLGAHLGGEGGLLVDVGQSNGNISDDGSCQTAHGDSSAASIDAGGNPVADVLQGDSTSTACSGSNTTDQHSTVLSLGGNGLPIPAQGCADGTPNTSGLDADGLLQIVCNAEDVNGSQTSAPYGVREALALFALINDGIPGGALLRVTAGSAESHAVAPGAGTTVTPPGNTGGGTKGAGGKGGNGNGGNNGGNGNGGGAGAGGAGGGGGAANEAAAGNGSLAFTGADLLVLGLIGGALILGGLALTTLAGRRHRQTV